MDKEEMIKVIYEKIADKTLNRWCKFNHDWIKFTHSWDTNADEVILESIEEWTAYIIWHPVNIWDCLSYFNYKTIWVDYTTNDILKFWDNKRKPIENQTPECIEYIYNLLK